MTDLDKEINRIATFVKWQLNYPNPLNLARAGLAYRGTGDAVYCYKCQCVISDWKQSDVPLDRHWQSSPNCPFVASYSLSLPVASIAHPPEDRNRTRNQIPVQQPSLYQSGASLLMNLPSAPSKTPLSNPSSIAADSIGVSHLKFESQRLRTFDTWENPSVNKGDLAKAGFYFTRIGDCVKCVFCSSILRQWERGDIPLNEHRKHSPKCPFVLGLDVGNIPEAQLTHDQPTLVMQPVDSVPATGGRGGGVREGIFRPPQPDYSPYETRNSLNFDLKFADVKQRLRSYDNMMLPRGQEREVLAEAGFYYVGPGDSVKCFQCGGVLKKWSESDEPWIEHAKWFPNCIYLLQAKGYQFINDIQRQFNASGSMMNQFGHREYPSHMESSNEDTMPKTSIQETEQEESTSLKQRYLPSSTYTSYPSAGLVPGTVNNVQLPSMITHPSDTPSSSSSALPSSSSSSLPSSSSSSLPSSSASALPSSSSSVLPSSSSSSLPSSSATRLKESNEENEDMAKENERLKDAILCKICMDAMANTVFLPCGHLLCCDQCAPAISDCPVCRGSIKGTLKVYIS